MVSLPEFSASLSVGRGSFGNAFRCEAAASDEELAFNAELAADDGFIRGAVPAVEVAASPVLALEAAFELDAVDSLVERDALACVFTG